MLIENHKKTQMDAVLMFLMCHSEESVKFLDSRVIGDETWVFHHTPDSQQQSIEWHHTHSPTEKKFKINHNQENYGNCLLRPKGGSYG